MNGPLSGFGGHLVCTACRRTQPLGDPNARTFGNQGWPKCCGHTMRWVTASQIAEGKPLG